MNIEKIKKFIAKNQLWVTWGIVVLSVSILLIWAILSIREKRQPDSVTLIDTPLQLDVTHAVKISESSVEDTEFPDELPVYPLTERNYNPLVDTFLSKLKIGNLQKSSIQGLIYTWVQSDNYVEYVPNAQSLFFRFSSPVSTEIGTSVIDSEAGSEFLQEFISQYLGRDYTFLNVEAKQSGGKVRIEANRDINGYPLFLRDTNGASDYLIVNASGEVYEGRLSLLEYSEDEAETISLVHISNLQGALSESDYPKEVFQGYNPIIADMTEGDEAPIDENGIPRGDVTNDSVEFPIATSSVLESAQMVYFFSDMSVGRLSPVYRLESEGEVEYSGETIVVPLVVYANALDPNRVYISEQ